MAPSDTKAFVESLEGLGLIYLDDGMARDMVWWISSKVRRRPAK